MSVGAVKRCSALDIFDDQEFGLLVELYGRECADPGLSAAVPSREFYGAIEGTGATLCFRCLVGERMVGFALVLVAPSGHNGQRYATVESIFVSEEGRVCGLGTALMETMAHAAREAGCEAIMCVAHVGSRLAQLLFLLTETYRNTGYLFCRRLA